MADMPPHGSFRDIIDPERVEEARDELDPAGEDNEAHAGGRICTRCGQVIRADQAARLTGVHDWVHDICPVVTG